MGDIAEKMRLAKAKAEAMIKPQLAQGDSATATASNGNVEQFSTTDKQNENMDIRPSSFNLRPVYSRVDINNDKWLLTMDEPSRNKLDSPPSLADGLDRETEAELRYLGCELIQSGSILLKLPQTAAATGQILFQRFYYQKSFVQYMFEHYVMACLLLASKIEEEPRRPRDVYNVFHRLEQLNNLRRKGVAITKESTARLKPRPLDINYHNAKNNIIKAERRIMSTLGFVVHVKHPHKLICSYIYILEQSDRTDLVQKAWSYMNDGLRTDMFLRFTPETIACACIYLAARTVEPPIALPKSSSSSFHWFELFDASDRDVDAIAMMLQTLYTRQRAPNMDRLISILDKIRQERDTAEKAKQAKLVADKLLEKQEKEKTEKDAQADRENNRTSADRQRSRSRSRSRSPRREKRDQRDRDRRYRGERDSPDRRRRGGGGGGGDRRRDNRDDRRRRSRSRDRSDKFKVDKKIREKEVYMALGKRYRKESVSPPPRSKK